jgi:hypothetical protein
MADYVEYSTRVATVPGPLTAEGATEWGFGLEADPEKLGALCKRVFFEPTGGKIDIRPLGRHVLLTLGRIDKLVSDLHPFDTMGYSPESQIDIWIPAARVEKHGDHVVAEELLMFMPYIWIDNTISLPSGREMYGYPKAYGEAILPKEGEEETRFGVDVFGMNFGGADSPSMRKLIRIQRGKHLPELAGINFSSLIDIGHYLRELVEHSPGQAIWPGWELAEQVWDDARDHRLRQVFLKQVRSIEDGRKAALQQVTEAGYRILEMDGDGLDYEYECTIEKIDSHPLVDDLGLKNPQVTRWAFRTKADFTLETGRVLWDSATP